MPLKTLDLILIMKRLLEKPLCMKSAIHILGYRGFMNLLLCMLHGRSISLSLKVYKGKDKTNVERIILIRKDVEKLLAILTKGWQYVKLYDLSKVWSRFRPLLLLYKDGMVVLYPFRARFVQVLSEPLWYILLKKCLPSRRFRRVLDVGTHIGDSLVYLISLGAKYVDGFEPNPLAYKLAKINAHILSLKHNVKINLYMKAITFNHQSSIKIPITIYTHISGAPIQKLRILVLTVPAVSFKEILRQTEYDLVKLNCMGCEHELIRIEGELLKRVQCYVIVFYIYNRMDLAILRKMILMFKHNGFKVTLSKPYKREFNGLSFYAICILASLK